MNENQDRIAKIEQELANANAKIATFEAEFKKRDLEMAKKEQAVQRALDDLSRRIDRSGI